MIDKIFVYGTLKPGGRNYHLAKGVTEAEPVYLENYTLLHFDPEGYPAMVPGEGRVYGVVLTFEDIEAALPALDALERCHLSPPEYERVLVNIQPRGEEVWTYVYINQTRLAAEGVSPVLGGDWPLG
jgi:gamma-glutamylcyclotransferase (GGCT)/AIG2-like uncharacterized protein YtfP